MNLSLAIDYTASNGAYTNPTSLHSLNGQNQYEKAILCVGSILEAYDYDKSNAVYGFGGIPKF